MSFVKFLPTSPTDVYYPGTTDPINIWDFTDIRTYYHLSQETPFTKGVNGKNDTKVGWIQKISLVGYNTQFYLGRVANGTGTSVHMADRMQF
jgi:hypothetical protein